LNVHCVNGVRQTETHTAELPVQSQVPLRLRWLLKTYKDTNHQVLIKSQQNWLKQREEQFALRSI